MMSNDWRKLGQKLNEELQTINDTHDQRMAQIDLLSKFYDAFNDALGANDGKRADCMYTMFVEFLKTCKAEGIEPLQVLQPRKEPSEKE